MAQVIVNKEDLEAANAAIKELRDEISEYFRIVNNMMERWRAQELEIARLRARLSEFEVQS